MNEETKGVSTKDPKILTVPSMFNEDMETTSTMSVDVAKEERGYIDWFVEGAEHSGVATALMNWLGDEDPFSDKEDIQLTDEQRREIYEKVNWSSSAFKAVTRGLKDINDLDHRLERVLGNIEFQNEVAQAGFFEGLSAGLGDAVVDPVNYMGGAVLKTTSLMGKGMVNVAGRVAGQSVLNVASGQVREKLSGADTDILQDALAGAVFAGVFEGASKGFNLMGDANRRFKYVQNQNRLGLPISKDVLKHLGGNSSVAPYMDRAREWLNKAIPAIQISEVLYRNESTRGLASRLYRRNQGTLKEVDGQLVNVEVATSTPTIEERIQVEENALWEFQSEYFDTKAKMVQLGIDEEDFNSAIYAMVEGRLPPKGIRNEPELSSLAVKYKQLIESRGQELQNRGFLENLKENYGAPRVIDRIKAINFTRSFGGDKVKAISALADNLVRGVQSDKKTNQLFVDRFLQEVQERLDREADLAVEGPNAPKKPRGNKKPSTKINKLGKDLNKQYQRWLKKQAMNDATGYIDQNQSSYGITDDGKFISKYDHERLPWNTSYRDATGFSVDSLRIDPSDAFRNYWRHSAGDIAWYDELGLMGYENVSNYMQTKYVEGEASMNRAEAGKVKRALKNALNLTYGISPKEHFVGHQATPVDAFAEIVRNITFFTKNGFMGILNHTEVAEGIKAYGASFFLRSVPWVRNKFKNWSQGHYTNEDITAINNSIFGEEVKSVGIFSRSWEETKTRAKLRYQEIERRNKDRYDEKSRLRKIVSATQWLSEVSPATRYLQQSQRSIVDEARGQFMGELVRTAHGLKKGHKGFFNEKDLKRNSISADQAEHLIDTIRNCTKVNSDGSLGFTDLNKLYNDTDAMLTLRRMGDYVANNVIQRNTMGDAFYWADVNNPMLDLLFQFKTFAINSWTKRALRMVNRGFEGEREAVEQFLTFSISGGLATFGHIGITYIRAYGIQDEEKRKKYLERQLGSTEGIFDLDSDVALTAIWNGGFQRNGIFAFPALVLASLPYGNREAKTTTRLSQTDDEGKPLKSFDFGDYLGDMVPAFGTINSIMSTPAHAWDMMVNMDNYTPEEQDRVRRNLNRQLKNLAPNYPVVTPFILSFLNNKEK